MSQTVVSSKTTTNTDGSTNTVTVYSDGSISEDWTPAPGSPIANAQTITQRIDTGIANLQNWVANNPNGAVLNAAQTLTLAKLLIGLAKAVRGSYNDTNGT